MSDLSAAVNRLPSLTIAKTEAVTATGTDDGQNVVAGLVAGFSDNQCKPVRTIESEPPSGSKAGCSEQPLKTQGGESDCESLTEVEIQRRRRDSNPRWRICNPLTATDSSRYSLTGKAVCKGVHADSLRNRVLRIGNPCSCRLRPSQQHTPRPHPPMSRHLLLCGAPRIFHEFTFWPMLQ